MNTIIGFFILLFIFWQAWLIAKYFYLRWKKPLDKHKFPLLATIIFVGCFLFYLVAFLLSYSP